MRPDTRAGTLGDDADVSPAGGDGDQQNDEDGDGELSDAGRTSGDDEPYDPQIFTSKMKLMEGMIALLDGCMLEHAMGNLEIEDRRTQFLIKDVSDKLDRLDSTTKKRNLLFDGIPEMEGRNENTGCLVCEIFYQLNVNKGINFDACYRVGPFSKNKPRPILVSLDRQAD